MKANKDTAIWSVRWVRELTWILCLVVLCFIAYEIRVMLAPLGVAFLLSYAVSPAATHLERFRVPRVASAVVCLLLFIVAIAVFWAWASPKLVDQLSALQDRLPKYLEVIGSTLGVDVADLDEAMASLGSRDSKDVGQALQIGKLIVSGVGQLFGFVGTITAATLYAIVAGLLVAVFFVVFVTYKDWARHLDPLIPREYRNFIYKAASNMDQALGVYVRGQLLVALFTFTGFSFGFFLADVPYWFVVALIGGVFSLVPYGQLLGLIGAVLLRLLESQTGDAPLSMWGVLMAPAIVYAITQSMESWVITPLVQGQANKLHPALIITVLILGGSIAGVVGLILAIPVSATVKSTYRDFSSTTRDVTD